MLLTLIRFLEIFFSCAILSSCITALNVLQIATNTTIVVILLTAAFLIFVFLNIQKLLEFYLQIKNKFAYYITNCIAYLIFMFASIGIYHFGADSMYAWLFAIMKFLRYSGYNISTFVSALIFHGIMIAIILFLPVITDACFITEYEEFDGETEEYNELDIWEEESSVPEEEIMS